MYTTPDEDRSDLYLAGAVFILGPVVVDIVLRRLPVPGAIQPLVSLAVVVATTVLVPFLLIRYRKERIRDFGFTGSQAPAVTGLLVALPIVAAYAVANVVAGQNPAAGVPVVAIAQGGVIAGVVRIVAGACIGLLVIYATVKARSAFSPDPRYIRTVLVTLGRIAGIAAAVAAALLLVTLLVRGVPFTDTLEILLVPAALAGSVWLIHRGLQGSVVTSRPTLLTPMVLLAIGAVRLFAPAFDLVFGLWRAALLAGVGLALGALLESKRSAWAPLGMVAGLVLLTPLLP